MRLPWAPCIDGSAISLLFNSNSSLQVAAVMSKANEITVGPMYRWLRYLCVIGIAAYK